MEMPGPSAEHLRLEEMAGEWEGEEKLYPSPWGATIGRMNSRIGLNGFALLSDYSQQRDGVIIFTGHGVFTFNPKDALYTLIWFDFHGITAGSLQRPVRRIGAERGAWRRRHARPAHLQPVWVRPDADQHGDVAGREQPEPLL
jgi:hypothetical protein